MRDYVKAIKAVWDTWQNGTKLDYQGEFYNLNLMVPLFDAGPIENPNIPNKTEQKNKNKTTTR